MLVRESSCFGKRAQHVRGRHTYKAGASWAVSIARAAPWRGARLRARLVSPAPPQQGMAARPRGPPGSSGRQESRLPFVRWCRARFEGAVHHRGGRPRRCVRRLKGFDWVPLGEPADSTRAPGSNLSSFAVPLWVWCAERCARYLRLCLVVQRRRHAYRSWAVAHLTQSRAKLCMLGAQAASHGAPLRGQTSLARRPLPALSSAGPGRPCAS